MSEAAKETSPRRTPPAGGYARGEETRARIIAAGLKVFGEEGYEGASTRQIAKAAGVMPPALQYYFDSKEGLHLACGEVFIDLAGLDVAGALETAEHVLSAGRPAAAADALCDVLDTLVDVSLSAKESPDMARFSARIQSEEDSPAGVLIETRIVGPIRDVCARLIACAIGSPLNEDARIRGLVILSQLGAFSFRRDSWLRDLGWPDFNGARREAIKAVLRAHTKAALKA